MNIPDLCNRNPHFVNYHKLTKDEKNLIDYDFSYDSDFASLCDAAFQAWKKGIMCNKDNFLDINSGSRTVRDNYKFIRKYYAINWNYIILFIRLLTLNNWWKEIESFMAERKTPRTDLFRKTPDHIKWIKSFDSPLLKSNQKVSVIIPTLNRYQWLEKALFDLEDQLYNNFEVIIVDQSKPFDKDFYQKFNLDIVLVQQNVPALWRARNTALQKATGNFILFYEDDVRVAPDWIQNHLLCLDYFNCDISAGIFGSEKKNVSLDNRFFHYADQFATGNACVRRGLFKTTGLFDCQFEGQRGGDRDFGIRALVCGFKAVSNPLVFCKDIKAGSGGLREMGLWDSFRSSSLLSPRPAPSILYSAIKHFGVRPAALYVLRGLSKSYIPYRFKNHPRFKFLAPLIFLLLLPIATMHLVRSFCVAKVMLKEGEKIPEATY